MMQSRNKRDWVGRVCPWHWVSQEQQEAARRRQRSTIIIAARKQQNCGPIKAGAQASAWVSLLPVSERRGAW